MTVRYVRQRPLTAWLVFSAVVLIAVLTFVAVWHYQHSQERQNRDRLNACLNLPDDTERLICVNE